MVAETQCLRLDGPETTIVFGWSDGVPCAVHHGSRLPDDLDLAEFVASRSRSLPQATLDSCEAVSMHPENGRGWLGQPALAGNRSDTATPPATGWTGRFAMLDVKSDPAANRVQFKLQDSVRELLLAIDCCLDTLTDVATFQTTLSNTGQGRFNLEWLAAATLAPTQNLSELKSFHGRWCGEFEIQTRSIPLGLTAIVNRRGRTSHESFPGFVFCENDTSEERGECIGLHLGWSGNHQALVERLSTGDVQAQMGEHLLSGECVLESGESFSTPTLYVAHAASGLNAMSQKFHQHVRQRLLRFPDPSQPRPVTVNTWEALYFDHDRDAMRALVDAAADIGAERFVLDDGWFRGRNDDTSSLGDWYADPVKYPQGLGPLADYVRSMGMQFGLWVEPEMANPDSDLLRAHPEWALGLDDYPTITGRNQLVLDLANPEVEAYLFERLESLVQEYDVDYLKWDMNREYVMPADERGGPGAHRQVQVVYRLYDRLLARFANLEIESCASGGGRVDYGILARCHRFWASDSNDAVERMRIQTGFTSFFPPEVMGAHIGPRWSHTSGRGLHTGLRALVAGWGHLGIEADLTRVDAQERKVIREAVLRYKRDRDIWHRGRIYRIQTADTALLGVAGICARKSRARIVLVQIDRPRATLPPPIRLSGLDEQRSYRVSITSSSEMISDASRRFDNPIATAGYVTTGAVIARVGITLPSMYAQTGLEVSIDAVDMVDV